MVLIFFWNQTFKESPIRKLTFQVLKLPGKTCRILILERIHLLKMWMFPKNRGIPKWMVKIMETPIKMDDLGIPLFLETPMWLFWKVMISQLGFVVHPLTSILYVKSTTIDPTTIRCHYILSPKIGARNSPSKKKNRC